MSRIIRPEPIDKEIILDPAKVIMSKTDAKGVIMYANEYFMKICGYLEHELMGQQHNVIRHPDMPRIIFDVLWQRLKKGQNIHAVVKNLAKDGSYYWVVTNFSTKYDENGKVISHYSHRKAAPRKVIKEIEKLYGVLLALEKNDRTMKLSKDFLVGMLEESKTTYDKFVLEVLGYTEQKLQSYFMDPKLNLNLEQKNNKKNNFFRRFFS